MTDIKDLHRRFATGGLTAAEYRGALAALESPAPVEPEPTPEDPLDVPAEPEPTPEQLFDEAMSKPE
jgi:hypothetical protein